MYVYFLFIMLHLSETIILDYGPRSKLFDIKSPKLRPGGQIFAFIHVWLSELGDLLMLSLGTFASNVIRGVY
jgi:hypothetical protein